MKRYGNLWDKIVDKDNLYLAYRKARKRKTWQRKVQRIDKNVDEHIENLHKLLISGQYKTAEYKTKIIYEPKQRTIYILPFYPDRIVHHAIMNILEPLWDKLFTYHSYACRHKKGQHRGSRYCMELTRQYQYCLKCDVSKFYPSINHEVLKGIIKQKLKDKKLLKLLEEIIDSTNTETNVPIGNYLSQWFGNLYLNELDTLIKHKYHVKAYLRYCDDFLIFSDSKEELHKLSQIITTYVGDVLKLRLSKCDVFPTSRGVDFLGYRHFPKGYILIRKTTAKRIKKRMKALIWNYKHHKVTQLQAMAQVVSTEGLLCHATSYNFSKSLKLDEIKEYIQMKGFPKYLNTKEDYLYVLANYPKEQVKPLFQNLLDTMEDWFSERVLKENEEVNIDKSTQKIVETQDNMTGETVRTLFTLKVNPMCRLLSLGFTKEEVEGIINE